MTTPITPADASAARAADLRKRVDIVRMLMADAFNKLVSSYPGKPKYVIELRTFEYCGFGGDYFPWDHDRAVLVQAAREFWLELKMAGWAGADVKVGGWFTPTMTVRCTP